MARLSFSTGRGRRSGAAVEVGRQGYLGLTSQPSLAPGSRPNPTQLLMPCSSFTRTRTAHSVPILDIVDFGFSLRFALMMASNSLLSRALQVAEDEELFGMG